MIVFAIYFLLSYSVLRYSGIINPYIKLWPKKGPQKNIHIESYPQVDVLIAARNESQVIQNTLDDLMKQNYPHFQIILIDDHSTDNTWSIVNDLNHSKLKVAINQGKGKKEALETALQISEAPILLMTDADVRIGMDWIASMVQKMQATEADLVCGPVTSLTKQDSILNQYYFHEMLGWMVITGAAINGHLHPSGNGANILVKKDQLAFPDPFSKKISASGDDIFLIEKVMKEGRVVFNSDTEAMVQTYPPASWHEWIQQKCRWSSKNRGIRNKNAQSVLFHVAFIHAMIFITAIGCILFPVLIPGLILSFLIKTFIDYRLLKTGSEWMGQGFRWINSLWLQAWQIPLILWVGLRTQMNRPIQWKGRHIFK